MNTQSDLVAVTRGRDTFIHPLTNRGHDFVDGDVDTAGWERRGDALVVGPSMASLIIEVAQNLGLEITFED